MPATMNRVIKSQPVSCTDSAITDLSDCRGDWCVLVFYPKDNTSGCSLQAEELTAAITQLSQLNARVIGVSRDSIKSHVKFIEKLSIAYPLISDPDAEDAKVIKFLASKSNEFGRHKASAEKLQEYQAILIL